jgi:hypothetical protein
MIAERITQLVAQCDQLTPPSGSNTKLWSEYRHALQQQLIVAEAIATKLDVGETTGRFDRDTASVKEFAGVGGGSRSG